MEAALAELHGKRQLLDAASDDVARLRAQLDQAEHVLRVATCNYTFALNVYQQSDSLRVLSSPMSCNGARGSSQLAAAKPRERRPREPVIKYDSWELGCRDDTDRRTRIMDPPIDLLTIQAHNFVVKVAGHHTPTGCISNEVYIYVYHASFVWTYIPINTCVHTYIYVYLYIYIYTHIYVIVHLQVSVTSLVHI